MTRVWRLAHARELALDQPQLMAIVNATPDSFSDGGLHLDPQDAIAHAKRCVDEGAAIIDVGGESTRPGASRIDAAEQIRRVLPIVEGVACLENVLISIDTTRAEVARAAIDAGAHIINDVSAGTEDQQMFGLAAESGAGLILMHRLRPPDADSYSDRYASEPRYGDVVAEVGAWLADRAEQAIEAGVSGQQIVIDPGLGFGKSVAQNFELIARVAELQDASFPLLSAASRKSFIGRAMGVEVPSARVSGSVAITIHQFLAGVRLFRVHDVRAHREALDVVRRIGGRL